MLNVRSSIAIVLLLSLESSRPLILKPAIVAAAVATVTSVWTPAPCETVTGDEVATGLPLLSYAVSVTTAQLLSVSRAAHVWPDGAPRYPTRAEMKLRVVPNVPTANGTNCSQPGQMPMFATWKPDCASPAGGTSITGLFPVSPLPGWVKKVTPCPEPPASAYWLVSAVPGDWSSKPMVVVAPSADPGSKNAVPTTTATSRTSTCQPSQV